MLATALAMSSAHSTASDEQRRRQRSATQEKTRVWMTINGARRFAVALENSPSAHAFAQLLPLTLDMADLNDNEKHARLPQSLPAQASPPGTLQAGDVMLYGSDTLVVFYKRFASRYSYTRIGRVTPVDGLVMALGPGSPRIGFALE